jgi:threonine dehydratase
MVEPQYWYTPTLTDILAARQRIRPYLPPTPLHTYSALNTRLGTRVYVKHENYQPVGAFKVRGGINLVAQMSADERARGVISASTGNHGQSVAYAARLFGVTARIVVPEGANPGKVKAMQGMGAEVIFHGAKFDDARRHCEALAAEHGYRYIHSGNEPHLVAGVATATLEMLEAQPDIDVILVPIGGGSGACGASLTAHAINPRIRVIGVQSEAAPAAYQSWRQRAVVEAPNQTVAEGLSTGRGFELPQQILWEHLDDFVLVSDADILRAVAWYLEDAHALVEEAGAAPLAAAWRMRAELAGKTVGLICSGGNISLANLRRVLAAVD